MIQRVYFRSLEGESEIAITFDGVLENLYRLSDGFLTGAIFVGRVVRVSKQLGAFVDIGLEREGLLAYRDGLKSGDCVTVQVKKEQTKEKGCALTEKLTLAGRYAVLNDAGEIKFSHKISEERKIELFGIAGRTGTGFIFRTACEYACVKDVEKECEGLVEKYRMIKERAARTVKIACLYREEARDVALRYAYSDEGFSENFSEVEEQIRSLNGRRVTVCGVELVFDKTEALTAVDINFHRYAEKYADAEITALNANLIAVRELARQLRLRNIGGIIVVDYISMKNREYVGKLKDALAEELKKDNVKITLESVESVGLFILTRRNLFGAR